MPLDPNILSEITGRFRRVRSGLAVGFADAAVADALRGLRGGVWLTDPGTGALPFEDEPSNLRMSHHEFNSETKPINDDITEYTVISAW